MNRWADMTDDERKQWIESLRTRTPSVAWLRARNFHAEDVRDAEDEKRIAAKTARIIEGEGKR